MKRIDSLGELYAKMAADIERTGRSVINVMPTEDFEEPCEAFSYSVGNAIKGLPELLIIGMRPHDGTWFVNAMSEMMIERGGKFANGEIVNLGGGCPVCVIDAAEEAKADYTIQAGRFLEEGYDVMQIIASDPNGKFPWDEGCVEPYALVKVLGRLAS